MKHILPLLAACALALEVNAQGRNTGMGGNDGDFQSIAERVSNLEKKNDLFNVYFNYAASYQLQNSSLEKSWKSTFANKQLRLEIKGNVTDKLYYRLRHRLNKATDAKGQDNFAKATDIMMVGYDFSPKFTLQAGKMGQLWGGYEYDENPMYIYQYSDFVTGMDVFMAGILASIHPLPSQELVLQVTDANNGSFNEEQGDNPVLFTGAHENAAETLEKANHPLTYIVNWNGDFFNGKLTTRWAWGIQTQAKNKYSRMITLGQQLHLGRMQWYVDYMGAFEDIDRLGVVNNELLPIVQNQTDNNTAINHIGKTHYNSIITKMNWQFRPSWNLMLKGAYETASASKMPQFKNYRKCYTYASSLEYYPVKHQDLRVFLAYIGQKINYKEKSQLTDYNTNRLELGFMYRIKAF